jgi:hypothetical protein
MTDFDKYQMFRRLLGTDLWIRVDFINREFRDLDDIEAMFGYIRVIGLYDDTVEFNLVNSWCVDNSEDIYPDTLDNFYMMRKYPQYYLQKATLDVVNISSPISIITTEDIKEALMQCPIYEPEEDEE